METTAITVCFECDAPATLTHHVVPQCRGGTKTVPLCDACHARAHDQAITTAEMTRHGLAKRRAAGFRLGGHIPYGYRVLRNGQLEPVEAEQAVIRDMVVSCAGGKGFSAMAKRLNRDGVPTRTGTAWSRRVVREIWYRVTTQAVAA